MIKILLRLLRVQQWYKNLLVFLPLVFGGLLFSVQAWIVCILGFIALSFVSSFNYVMNDVRDVKLDRMHPEKKTRPLAAGKISQTKAIIIAFVLLVMGVLIGGLLDLGFLLLLVVLIVLTNAYSLWFKHVNFIDLLLVPVNFVLRALGGVLLLRAEFSSWLVLCAFLLALFLVLAKRYGDLLFLEANAVKTRKVLEVYSPELLRVFMGASIAMFILSYSLFAFSRHPLLLFTLPLVFYTFFVYTSRVLEGAPLARHPEKVFGDRPMLTGIIFWGVITVILLYYPVLL